MWMHILTVKAIFTLALCQVSSHHFFFFFFFALSRCKHCFPNLKGWGLRVFCQPGYPCLTVLRLQTAITGKFILFTLVIQRNINHSACTPTEQLYSSTYGDKSRTVSEIELTVTGHLEDSSGHCRHKKKNPRKQSFFGDWMKMAILNNFYSLYCMKRKLLTRWFNSGKQIEFLSSRCCKCDYCSLNVVYNEIAMIRQSNSLCLTNTLNRQGQG